jgi:NADH:ubiquinone oxidoreductase subunit 6 (subunit J)
VSSGAVLAASATDTGLGEAWTFWILGPIAVLASVGMLVSRKAVHSALLLAATMLSLAVLYLAQDAPFLGVVQVVVYTGAVMMLFLFVLMLVGVDSGDSLVETLRGQRVAAVLAGLGFGALLVFTLGDVIVTNDGLEEANAGGNVVGLADHGGHGCDGARAPRAPRAACHPAGPVGRALPRGRLRGSLAATRSLRPAQRGRHPGAPSRRLACRDLRVEGAGGAR